MTRRARLRLAHLKAAVRHPRWYFGVRRRRVLRELRDAEAEAERLRRDWKALRVLAWADSDDGAFRDQAKMMLGEPDA